MKIEFKSVFFKYDNPMLISSGYQLEDISFSFGYDQLLGITGSNGAGKTTLVQIMAGLQKPDAGEIIIRPPMSENRLDGGADSNLFGIVFQFPEMQLFEKTVADDIGFGPRQLGLPQVEVQKRIFQAADRLHIKESLLERRIDQLSYGEKRKVAIAGVLALHPQVLILDEPTAGLDPISARLLQNMLQEIHGDGICIIIVSHDVDLLFDLTDRIIVLERGRLHLDFQTRDWEKCAGGMQELLPLPRLLRLKRHINHAEASELQAAITNTEFLRKAIEGRIVSSHSRSKM